MGRGNPTSIPPSLYNQDVTAPHDPTKNSRFVHNIKCIKCRLHRFWSQSSCKLELGPNRVIRSPKCPAPFWIHVACPTNPVHNKNWHEHKIFVDKSLASSASFSLDAKVQLQSADIGSWCKDLNMLEHKCSLYFLKIYDSNQHPTQNYTHSQKGI